MGLRPRVQFWSHFTLSSLIVNFTLFGMLWYELVNVLTKGEMPHEYVVCKFPVE